MRLNKLIYKLHSKIKLFCVKYFGNNKKAYRIIKLILSILIASDYYYYMADVKSSEIAVFAGFVAAIYILVSILAVILKYILNFLKRFRSMNIILFSALVYCVYNILRRVKSTSELDFKTIYIMTFVVSLIFFVFSKTAVSVFRNKKKLGIPFLIMSTAGVVFVVGFLIWPGEKIDNSRDLAKIGVYDIKKPAMFGSKCFEYGDYGDDAKTVNLLKYASYSGRKKKVRDRYFGQGLGEVPIKGRVWYPIGREKSPVVFIAHGNHRMTEENYKGYDYLGRYLARRGYVVVSVDMNMLNGFMKFGLGGENDARAVLLLENIGRVLELNEDEGSKFYNLIDPENIVIAGHSRGGEAVVIAEMFNGMRYNPDNGSVMDYNFNIKGVISIAPTVDQYNPSGKNIEMTDVNYLVLHGTNDKDVKGFSGMKIFDNVHFTENSDNFKSAVYIGYANHGQFNELWGSYDADPPVKYFTNTASLLDSNIQKKILCLYVNEFLENTFNEDKDRGLFKDPQSFVLPKTLYYSRYADSSFENLVDFEDDLSLTTVKDGKVHFNGFSSVYEEEVKIGGESTGNTALYLSNNGCGTYSVEFDEVYDGKEYLQFDIRSMRKAENYNNKDLFISIVDDYGNCSKLKVNDYIELYPKIKVALSKLQMLSDKYDYKGSFQTVRIPIDDFIMKSKIVRTDIKKIEFSFGKDFYTSVEIDNIGFSL